MRSSLGTKKGRVENEDGEEKDHGRAVGRSDGSEADGDDLKTEVTIMDKDYREKIRDEASGEVVPRRMYIKKIDVEEHGHTVQCPSCISILRGTARQDTCRRRLEKEMDGDTEGDECKGESARVCVKEDGGR